MAVSCHLYCFRLEQESAEWQQFIKMLRLLRTKFKQTTIAKVRVTKQGTTTRKME